MKRALHRFRLWSRVALIALSLVPRASASGAQTRDQEGGKPAWTWTAEERVARRFDPAEMKSRAEAEERRLQKLVAEGMISAEALPKRAPGVQIDSFSGSENPELFMPWELFHSLLTSGFPPDGRHQKEFRQDRGACGSARFRRRSLETTRQARLSASRIAARGRPARQGAEITSR